MRALIFLCVLFPIGAQASHEWEGRDIVSGKELYLD